MAFSTIDRVRAVAGFNANEDVTDPDIETYLNRASSIVRSVVSGRYTLSDLSGSLFTGSDAQEYLRTAEDLIAAGLLLVDQYGERDPERTGYKKKAEGMSMLKDLKNGDARLIDINGAYFLELSSSPSLTTGISYTAPSLEDAPRAFSVGDQY